MKKTLKSLVLGVAVLALGVLMTTKNTTNNVNAANDTGTLQLGVSGGNITCIYTKDLTLSTVSSSYSSGYSTGNFASAFYCEDLKGQNAWQLNMGSDVLTNASNSALTIPAVNVELQVSEAPTVTSGACTAGSYTTTWTAIDSAQTILSKASATGQVCTVTAAADKVQLRVLIPANQGVGTYTGNLYVIYPDA